MNASTAVAAIGLNNSRHASLFLRTRARRFLHSENTFYESGLAGATCRSVIGEGEGGRVEEVVVVEDEAGAVGGGKGEEELGVAGLVVVAGVDQVEAGT